MGKTRNLNGLPGNLALSYLSTLGYYDGGYTADWLKHVSIEQRINEIEIDILGKTITPKEAEIKPLLADLDKLNRIINQELIKNGFERDFLTKAVLRFDIPNDKNIVHCLPLLKDKNGKTYEPKNKITEMAYETDFNPSSRKLKSNNTGKANILSRIKNLLT